MKKFSLSSDEMKKAFKKLGQAVNANTVLPVLKSIYCKVNGNELEMIASDLEITISYKCQVQTDEKEPFELLLPFDYLNKIVSVIGNMPITIELRSATKAKLLCEDDVYEINNLDKAIDFPKLPETPKKNSIVLDKNFIDIISKAMLTASKDEARPSMTRSLVDIKENESFVVSTDANHLFRHKLDIQSTKAEAIQFSKKMSKAIEGMTEINLSWTKDKVALRNEIITVWCKLYDDRYPDYNVVIPTYGPNLEIKKSDVEAMLNKALIAGNSTGQVVLHLKKAIGYVVWESADDDNGKKNTGKVPGDYSGVVETISVNAKKMLTMMDQVDAENLRLHIHDAKKAVLVSTEEDPNYLGLIMPLIF